MKVQNPIIWADFPDPDVIRVDDTYYMVTTTMFTMPGGPILKSKDLYHWEIVSHVFNTIEDNDIYQLKNGRNAYGKGQWATSLKFYRGLYYACFVCHDMGKTYVYYSEDIEKSGWDRYEIDGVYHDMSFLFDNDHAYLIYNGGDIGIIELKDDLSGVRTGGVNQLLFSTPRENIMLRCEGCRAYKLNGYYYLMFIEWPNDGNKRRRVVCYRSKELLGEYERKILLDDDMGYQNQGIAQGVIIDTPDGEWYSILFQDHGAVGRIPCLIPVSWENNWPVIGMDGKVPGSFEVPYEEYKTKPLIISDSFNHNEEKLDIRWEWNHNPEAGCWSFVENPGYLRLHTKSFAKDILTARNTLTQKTSGPECAFSIELNTEGMKAGDYAGLVALQGNYGMVGVKVEDNGLKKVLISKKGSDGQTDESFILLDGQIIFLKISFDFENSRDIASFYYSYNGNEWTGIGNDLKMSYTLDLFIGYRIGIFYYAQTVTGGFADFRNFTYETAKSGSK